MVFLNSFFVICVLEKSRLRWKVKGEKDEVAAAVRKWGQQSENGVRPLFVSFSQSENGVRPLFVSFSGSLPCMGRRSVPVIVDEVIWRAKGGRPSFWILFGVGQATRVVVKLGFGNNSPCTSVTETISGQRARSCLAEMRASSLGSILFRPPP